MTTNKFAPQMMQAAIQAQTVDEWWRLWERKFDRGIHHQWQWETCDSVGQMWWDCYEYRLKRPTEMKEEV